MIYAHIITYFTVLRMEHFVYIAIGDCSFRFPIDSGIEQQNDQVAQ